MAGLFFKMKCQALEKGLGLWNARHEMTLVRARKQFTVLFVQNSWCELYCVQPEAIDMDIKTATEVVSCVQTHQHVVAEENNYPIHRKY